MSEGTSSRNNEENPQQIAGAIEYPAAGSSTTREQPRPPRNLQDLLRFSTEVATSGGAAGSDNQNIAALDSEVSITLDKQLNTTVML